MTKSKQKLETTELILNSFVRRTEHTDQLKKLVLRCGAQLTRKGRSRNWLLRISTKQAQVLKTDIMAQNEPSWLWLNKRLAELQEAYEFSDLVALVQQTPGMTTSELMAHTNCSIAEARRALDAAEWCG